jgi:multisubunit Na+/H+ antiporter MnhB subunit
MFELLIALLLGYLAYRVFRGGFQSPQSRRLTGYGVIGVGIVFFVLLSLMNWLFPNLL